MSRGSIKQLWLECGDTDEPENESCYYMWMSKLVPMKIHIVLQAQSSVVIANQGPTVVYVKIENSVQRKVQDK